MTIMTTIDSTDLDRVTGGTLDSSSIRSTGPTFPRPPISLPDLQPTKPSPTIPLGPFTPDTTRNNIA